MSERVELQNLDWSSAGIFPGEAEISPFGFAERVASARRAGFAGISFWHTDLDAIRETLSLREIRAILDDEGVNAFEVEFIEDWFLDDEAKARSDRRKAQLLEASAELGAHHVKVGDFHNTPCEMSRLIDAFGALCDDAGRVGALIGFEFMKSAMIHRLDDCIAMVEGAGRRNGGLIVDIAHTNALGISNAAVAAIPRGRIVSAELNDNLKSTSAGYDPAARRFCGEGELDIAGFIAAVRATGYDGPWAVEFFNRAHAGWPLEKLDKVAYETTRPFL